MLDYRYFSYHPDYGYKLTDNKGRVLRDYEQVKHAVCFRYVFDDLEDVNRIYIGSYILKCRKQFVPCSGNYCSLNKQEIKIILRYMRRIFDIKIQLTEDKENYIFKFDIQGKPIKHKFVLTFCRVFFEFPYNEAAKDVFRLRSQGVIDGVNYSRKSFLELYHLTCVSIYEGYGMGHSLFNLANLDLRSSILKEKFKNGSSYVRNVYTGYHEYQRELKMIDKTTQIDWENNFAHRIKTYSDNYNRLKQIKYEKSIRRRRAVKLRKVD